MRRILIALIFVILTLLLSSCWPDNSESGSKLISVNVYLTDKPLSSIRHLWVDIDKIDYSVEASDESASVVELNSATTLDIISLANASALLFRIENIKEGENLLWIKLVIKAATIVIDNSTSTLEVSTPEKVIIDKPLVEDGSFILDFDLSRSIVEKGCSDIYELKPTFSWWMTKDVVYYIKGEVVDNEGNPVKGVALSLFLLNDDESTIVRFTMSDDKNGNFEFDGVPNGNYTIAVFRYFEILQEDASIMDLMDASDASTKVSINGKNKENIKISMPLP